MEESIRDIRETAPLLPTTVIKRFALSSDSGQAHNGSQESPEFAVHQHVCVFIYYECF